MSLLVNGREVQQTGGPLYMWFTRGREEWAPLRQGRSLIPFRHGQRAEPAYHDVRPVELEGVLKATDIRAQIDDLKLDFSPGNAIQIVDTLEDGTVRWLNAVTRSTIWEPLSPTVYKVSVELDAHDPFWYSAYGTLAMDSGIEMDDDYLMDSGGEIIVTSPTTEVTFTNPGTADSERIRVRFLGVSGGSVGIHNLSTPAPVGFTIADTLASGEEIVVNNFARTAKLDGTTNVRNLMTLMAGNRHGEYLRLIPGQNVLRVLGAPAEMRLTYFPAFL